MKKKLKIIYYIIIGLCTCYALFVLIYDIVAWIKDMEFPLTLTMILLPILLLIELSEHQIRKIDKENKQEKNN